MDVSLMVVDMKLDSESHGGSMNSAMTESERVTWDVAVAEK
jgi:hypothetical protein